MLNEQEIYAGLYNAMCENKDCTINGKCSSCGECCSNWLPLAENEINQIKNYIKKHKIKEYKRIFPTSEATQDGKCPFRNDSKKICEIYAIRPMICKSYQCNKTPNVYEARKLADRNVRLVDMHEEFYSKEE